MTLEIHIEETANNHYVHASEVEILCRDGWEIISHHAVIDDQTVIYSTMLKRDLSKRLDDSNLLEAVRRNSKQIERLEARLKVVENTLDDDTNPDDRAYSVALPLLDRVEIVEDAIAEESES